MRINKIYLPDITYSTSIFSSTLRFVNVEKRIYVTFLVPHFLYLFQLQENLQQNIHSSRNAFQLNYFYYLYGTYARSFLQVFSLAKRKLRVVGSGYFFSQLEKTFIVNLYLGLSHIISVTIKPPIFFRIMGRRKKNLLLWSFSEKELSKLTRKLRLLKKPDKYKGKGIRFVKEIVKTKLGKKKFV